MAEGKKFKMGRYGWMWVGIFGTALIMLGLYRFKNPFPAWMAKNSGNVNKPKTGDPCAIGSQTGTIQADGTCKV